MSKLFLFLETGDATGIAQGKSFHTCVFKVVKMLKLHDLLLALKCYMLTDISERIFADVIVFIFAY